MLVNDDVGTAYLATEHIRVLYQTSDNSSERPLVLALCAWGLRPNEVMRQFVPSVITQYTNYVLYVESDGRSRTRD